MNDIIKAEANIEIKQQIDGLIDKISLFENVSLEKINNTDEYINSASVLSEIKGLNKQLKAKKDELSAPFKMAIELINSYTRESFDIANNAEKVIKNAMIEWDNEQQRIKEKQEAEFRKAEEERIRKENEKLQKKIDKLEAKGKDTEELKEQIEANIPLEMIATKDTPKVDTVKYTTRYDFEIVDELAIPREYLKVDEVKIRKVVQALKDMCNISGIKVKTIKTIASK